MAGLAALGRQIGSIRMGVSMIGAIVAYVGTIFLAPIVSPMMGSVGIENPITVWWLTPIVVYILLFIMMNGIGQGLYMKVNLFFQYRAKADAQMRFARMDTNVGLALGIANGCVLLTIITVPIYVAGYVTVQFKSDDDPFLYNMLNRARTDLASTGFDKVSAALAPNTDELFMIADTASLVYHNSSVQDFIAEYPEFYHFVEEDTLGGDGDDSGGQDMSEDGEYEANFKSLLTGKGSLAKIFSHSKAQELLQSTDFMTAIRDLDYADLNEFIATGISAKYQDEKMVGKWRIDIPRSVAEYGRRVPQARPAYLSRVPAQAAKRYSDIHLILAPNGNAYLKGKAGSGLNIVPIYQLVAQRMGIQPVARNAATQQLAVGSWTAKDEKSYTISLDGKAGKTGGDSTLKSSFLTMIFAANPHVFYKFR